MKFKIGLSNASQLSKLVSLYHTDLDTDMERIVTGRLECNRDGTLPYYGKAWCLADICNNLYQWMKNIVALLFRNC
jgi:hypothetical protein